MTPYEVEMCFFFEIVGKEVLLDEAISHRELSPPIRSSMNWLA
jgi:hypothetical protein